MISVIVAIYNVERFVVKCIDSILKQTYTDFELILVDDGSTDSSGMICDEYRRKDERIRVIHKNNGGLSDARNVGIDSSLGEYVIFVDGDDYVHPQMLEIMYGLSIDTQADILACKFRMVSENEEIKCEYIEDVQDFVVYSRDEALNNLHDVLVVSCCKLFRRKVFENIRFPLGKYHEDEYIIHKLIYNANKIVVTNFMLYYYVQRESSITHSFEWKKMQHAMEAYRERRNFIDENRWINVKESQVRLTANFLYSSALSHTNELKKKHKREIQKELKALLRENREVKIDDVVRIYVLGEGIHDLYRFLFKIKCKIKALRKLRK